MNLILRVCLLVIVCCFGQSNAAGCSLSYQTDFPDKESVLLYNTNLLIEPENDAILLNAKDTIIVACPGSRNTVTAIGIASILAVCVSGQTLQVGLNKYLLSDLGCGSTVTGEFQATTTSCGAGRGVIKQIGHKINTQFLPLFEVCYDNSNGEAIYTDHVIYGSAIDYAKSVSNRPSFKVGGLASGVNAATAYLQATQKTTFADTLGSSALADKYIYPNSYLARGHLSPDADQVYVTSSFSTYFYMNTVPQWQQINNGNWKSVETSIRTTAGNLGEDLQVLTGGFEVLELEDINGNLAEMTLSVGKLPVPKFVWKIMYSLDTQKGIAFVSVNNPFVKTVTDDHYLCADICSDYGWGTANWDNSSKGLTYCCDIDDLREAVPTIPTDFTVSDIQEFVATKF